MEKEILENLVSLLKYKDKQYGSAYKSLNNIFGKNVDTKTHLYTRIDEKLSRIKNSEDLRKNDVTDFFCYLLLICKENGWNNFK